MKREAQRGMHADARHHAGTLRDGTIIQTRPFDITATMIPLRPRYSSRRMMLNRRTDTGTTATPARESAPYTPESHTFRRTYTAALDAIITDIPKIAASPFRRSAFHVATPRFFCPAEIIFERRVEPATEPRHAFTLCHCDD